MNTIISLNEANQNFLIFLKEKKRASATIIAYGKDIDQLKGSLAEEKKKDASQVRQSDLETFLSGLSHNGYTQKSVSRKINSFKTFFRFLKLSEFINDDPAMLISHPKYDNKPPRILSKIEYRALRDACRDDLRISAIVEILLQTGIRIGELANLKLDDVKDSLLYVRENEGHAPRDIPLNKAAKQALDRYLEIRPNVPEKTLFITKTGRPLLIRNIRTAIDRYFKMADIKEAKVNDLRHTFIAHHLMSGTSLVLVSKLAGHKRLSTTEKYLDLVKNESEGKIKLQEL